MLAARWLHVAMIACLAALAVTLHLGLLSAVGIAAVAGLLIYEHAIVKADDFSRVNAAFFTMNGWVSLAFFAFWAADIFVHRGSI